MEFFWCQAQDYEIRTYHPAKWVSTTLSGMQGEEHIKTGFRRLFNYIQGNNKNSECVLFLTSVYFFFFMVCGEQTAEYLVILNFYFASKLNLKGQKSLTCVEVNFQVNKSCHITLTQELMNKCSRNQALAPAQQFAAALLSNSAVSCSIIDGASASSVLFTQAWSRGTV